MTQTQQSQETYPTLTISTPKEFDFQQNLDYLARDHQEIMYHVTPNSIARRISLADRDFLIKITRGPGSTLFVEFLGDYRPQSATEANYVRDYIIDWFDLARDLRPFYALAETDDHLRESLKLFYGLRLIGIPNFFEALVWGILGQQINLTYAYQLKQRFVETYGDPLLFKGQVFWKFPDPETIQQFTATDLTKTLGITSRKGEYLADLAAIITSGNLEKDDFNQVGSLKAAEKKLTAIRGIGPWTANYVLMRSLRYPDAFPLADVGLQRAVQTVANLPQKASEDYLLDLSQLWNGWQAYATFYLWRLLY